MKKLILIFSVFFLFLFIGTATAQNYYNVKWYSSFPNGTTTAAYKPLISTAPGMYSDATSCTINMNIFGTLGTTISVNLLTNYYNPRGTVVMNSLRTITSNITNSPFGIITTSTIYGNNVYETESNMVWAGTQGFITLENDYTCTSTNRYVTWHNTEIDSESDRANTYTWKCIEATAVCASKAVEALRESNFNSGNSTVVGKGNWTSTPKGHTASHNEFSYFEYFVFNSSYLGLANFSVIPPSFWQVWETEVSNLTLTSSRIYEVYLYTLDNASTKNPLCSGTLPCAVNLVLNPNEIYVLMFHYEAHTAGDFNTHLHKIQTHFNVTIDIYSPAYICGGWSSCEGGYKWRTCTDANDIAPDRIEYRICYSAPEEELWLGFNDETYDVSIWRCFQEWDCTFTPDIITSEWPRNWSVSALLINYTDYLGISGNNVSAYPYDYVKVVDETNDADGDGKVLKMFYIPPKVAMPVGSVTFDTYSVSCENRTTGGLPIIRRGINETIFISKNVTFPSPYMSLFFNVKRCKEPEIQYPVGDLFGFKCEILPDNKACYTHSGNCTESPKATIWSSLSDSDSFETIWTHYSDVIQTNSWEAREISMDELDIAKNYTLTFAVKPKFSNLDTDAYCLYLDNVSFYIRDESIVCESFCDNQTYGLLHRAEQVGDACLFTLLPLSPACVSEDFLDPIENEEDFCDPNCGNAEYAFYDFNNQTGEWITILNSAFCVEWCAEKEEEEEITEVLTAEDFTTMMSFLLSPLFISIIISLGLGAFVSTKTKQIPMGLLTIVLFLMGFTILGFFPLWLFIILVIIAGFLLARGTLGTLAGGS